MVRPVLPTEKLNAYSATLTGTRLTRYLNDGITVTEAAPIEVVPWQPLDPSLIALSPRRYGKSTLASDLARIEFERKESEDWEIKEIQRKIKFGVNKVGHSSLTGDLAILDMAQQALEDKAMKKQARAAEKLLEEDKKAFLALPLANSW